MNFTVLLRRRGHARPAPLGCHRGSSAGRCRRRAVGDEPVRDWLKALDKDDRFRIGTDIKTVEFGWPIGMPACKPMKHGLFEVRTHLGNRVARVLFCIAEGRMVLLHGFIKKTQKTPQAELDLALERKRKLE